MFSYKEILSVLAHLEEEFQQMRHDKTLPGHERRFASYGIFILARVDKAFREKMQKKYGKKKNEKPDLKNKRSFWGLWK